MPSTTFTSSGTWTSPANIDTSSLKVECWGEGGSGGVGSAFGGAGGGGGGEYAANTAVPITANTLYSFTIGSGGSGSDTSFTGDSTTTTAHHGGNGGNGQSGGGTAGSAGTGSSASTHHDGGAGSTGGFGGAGTGGGGGGSAGSTGNGGAGGLPTGGSAGSGGGAAGGAGGAGSGTHAGTAGSAPGGGGGGGGGGGTGSGGSGQPGQITLTWTTLILAAPSGGQRREAVAAQLRFSVLSRATQAFVPPAQRMTTEAIRYPQHTVAQLIRHGRTAAPTGWPVPVQPPEIPSSEHARFKPPYPRKSVIETNLPEPVPTSWSYRARFKPPYPRRGVVASTGWPVPVQPPTPGSAVVFPHLRTKRRRPLRGTMPWPGTPPVAVQPPWSSWVYKRRWSKPLFPRRGVVPPEALPTPPIVTAFNPTSLRRIQRYQWFRRGNVAQTGWPVPVQPPMTSQSLRRWYKPPWPRKGVTPPTNIPEPVPTSWWMRRPQHYQWFRRGRALPGSGLPVPVQPPNVPHSVRRSMLRPLLVRHKSQPFSAFFIPVQPPERMQSVRRWTRPLWPRRGRTDIATFPGIQTVTGYQLLTTQTFTYIPGGPGLDLGTLGLTLFPLNKLGYTFWNRYGDVVFIIWNNTSLPIAITPNVIRLVELQSVTLPQYTLQPGVMQAFGPYPPNDFANPQLTMPDISYFMTIAVEANVSGVYAGAFRMVIAPPIGHTGQYDLLGVHLRRQIFEHHVHISATPGDIHPGETTPGA